VLVLWTVSHLQEEAHQVARAWGFTPKSLAFVWDKQALGMGYWVRQETEISLLCTRGKPPRLSKGVRQLIRAPRRKHSQKPIEQYGRIEDLVAGPYLELFARPTRRRRGWSYWGNELDRFVTVDNPNAAD
jgi:N6-adenosine-specific RNA methylase IME4